MKQAIAVDRVIVLLSATAAQAIASSVSYTTVTVPTGAQFTGINNIGQISSYGGAGEVQTGFILNRDGTVSTVYQSGVDRNGRRWESTMPARW